MVNFLDSDWFVVLFAPVVIGWSNNDNNNDIDNLVSHH